MKLSFRSQLLVSQLILAGLCSLACCGYPTPAIWAQDAGETPIPQEPILEPASAEGQQAIAQFKFPKGLLCELFAAEPDVANIVALHRDYQGRFFICETYRQEKGVEDNRRHAHWMDEELAAQTVQDRIDYIRKYIPDADTAYTAHDDRIRLLVDTNQNGSPDSVSVFANHFNKLEMGTGAGVLSYRGNVYYTCIPDLFLLTDTNQDGVADQRKSLHTGFGVRVAFRGHDMHGLIVGPDGRLYFSIGDRGYNISPTIKDPASGAVFRCELDGSNLEVIATGMRNPQELAFDDFGNLFTGDNNSDSGDQARWLEVLAGGDSGWRMFYQYQGDRGPFNREKIWHPYNADTPAYIVPPIENISDGPSGLEYYPGTGFGDDFKGRFFLCDFRGDAAGSGIRSFRNESVGAGWKLVDDEQPFWNMLVTDIDFGSDGRLYAADWVFGWNGENKGRIYAFSDPQEINTALVQQVESLLRTGLQTQATADLEKLIGHPDQRVRQEAQFELVERDDLFTLKGLALDESASTLARLHAVWGLGQLARKAISLGKPVGTEFISQLLTSSDAHVAAAAAGLAADAKFAAVDDVANLLSHPNLRVRYQAAQALSHLGSDKHVSAVVDLLMENNDDDATLRHGGIMALNGIFKRNASPDSGAVAALAQHDSRSVRIALAVALRKVLTSNEANIYRHKQLAAKMVAAMLTDVDAQIVLEAARTIHDVPAESEMSSLAALIAQPQKIAASDPLLRRVLSANVRVGTKASAEALALFASNQAMPIARRVEAVEALSDWAAPPARDSVLKDWRPLDPKNRNVVDAREAVGKHFSELTSFNEELTSAATAAAGTLNLTAIGSDLEKVVRLSSTNEKTRTAALTSLGKLQYEGLPSVMKQLVSEFDSLPASMAAQVIAMLAPTDSTTALDLIEKVIRKGDQVVQQSAIKTLGTMSDQPSAQLLVSLVKKLAAGELAANIRLDVVLAAENRLDADVQSAIAAYTEATVTAADIVSPFAHTKIGGNDAAGAKIFYDKTEVSCVRCHKIDGTGGAVGPELSNIGNLRDRQYLLESIVHPNKVIAEGYSQVKVMTDEGELFVGVVKRENEQSMVLMDADGKEIVIAKETIEGVQPGQSSMPADLINQLTKREVRDLVEYLANRKSGKQSSDHE